MKHARKYLACILSIIIAVAAFPTTAHAASVSGTDISNVTIGGVNYSLTQTSQSIQVTAREKGKIVDSCTAYLDRGYLIYKNNRTMKSGGSISTVSWLNDVVKEASPSTGIRMAAPTYTSWTRDGKYIFNPTQTSIYPKTFKNHTAYYWFRNVGTLGIDARKLNIKEGTAVTEVVALLAAIIGAVATTGWSLVAGLAVTGVISAGGGVIANGVVSRTISPIVGVTGTNYESKFLDAEGKGTGAVFKGSKVIVKTVGSKYYNEVFYEGYCPQISSKFGLMAFVNTFKGSYIKYPGVRSYVEL
jgi:hypothetical protein